MNQLYDVIIVGMGPAGSTAALNLCQAGLSVLAFDKQRHPRYKVCGGALSARVDKVLEPGFHQLIEQTIDRVRFTHGPDYDFEVSSTHPIVYMTMRDRLDHHLLRKAQQAGVRVREHEQVRDIREDTECIEVSTDQGQYRAKVLIGADGANSLVAQRLFTARRLKRVPALESEIPLASSPTYPAPHTLAIDFGATPRGYGWVFPKESGLSIGIAEFVGKSGKPREVLSRFLARDTALSQMMVPPPMGHPIPLFSENGWGRQACKPGSLVAGRALLIGDAGHLVDPLFGEGIYFAVYSAKLAAEAIARSLQDPSTPLSEYEFIIDKEIGQDLRIAARLVRVVYAIPSLCHRLSGHPFPQPFQELLALYCLVLQGKETYQSLLGQATYLTKDALFAKLSRRWNKTNVNA